ncbi:MAG: hypothetical protein L0H64_13985 [Pseudonocardia sp.]|nr:hypothetical protein [Pseudonocardia sp.]
MARKREMDEVEQVAGAVLELLLEAVQATIETRSPEPARECAAEFIDIDASAAPDESSGPAQVLATMTLVRRLTVVREGTADRPQRVEEVLAWVAETLGKRYAARARYVSGALESETGAAEVTAARRALQEEFLPALIWLLAGSVALYGAGRLDWLGEIASGGPSAAGLLTDG